MSRGNGRQDIFLSDKDRYLFLSLLDVLSERFNVEIYAYVLMKNHYHLLLKTVDGNLSKAMHWFGTTYTRKFNINNNTNGHLFQGRYKSIVVQNDAYLLRLSCYIHRNPLRSGIVDRLADFKWSSYQYYAYKKKPPAWLNTQPIFNQISGKDRPKAYRMKVQHYSEEEARFLEDIKHGLIYGSQDFIAEIKDRFLGNRRDEELPQQNSLLRDYDVESVLKKASKILGVDIESIRSAKKVSATDKDNRDLLIFLVWKTDRFSNKETGALFGLTYSAISQRVNIVKGKIAVEKKMRDKYNLLKSKIKV